MRNFSTVVKFTICHDGGVLSRRNDVNAGNTNQQLPSRMTNFLEESLFEYFIFNNSFRRNYFFLALAYGFVPLFSSLDANHTLCPRRQTSRSCRSVAWRVAR